ncbi:hypothetical protein C8J57DRAFT_1568418 [Mycena rebaudengoi]|nr:hypothetical protein C8J57DRAFT_1568418 [Mycena rebaudengoi]
MAARNHAPAVRPRFRRTPGSRRRSVSFARYRGPRSSRSPSPAHYNTRPACPAANFFAGLRLRVRRHPPARADVALPPRVIEAQDILLQHSVILVLYAPRFASLLGAIPAGQPAPISVRSRSSTPPACRSSASSAPYSHSRSCLGASCDVRPVCPAPPLPSAAPVGAKIRSSSSPRAPPNSPDSRPSRSASAPADADEANDLPRGSSSGSRQLNPLRPSGEIRRAGADRTGTTLLMALPLGALLCFFNPIGVRALARGELRARRSIPGQSTHQSLHSSPCKQIPRPSGLPPHPPRPIFKRMRDPGVPETSFYANTRAMFTDPTSYQTLFNFIVIKPSITLIFSIGLLIPRLRVSLLRV